MEILAIFNNTLGQLTALCCVVMVGWACKDIVGFWSRSGNVQERVSTICGILEKYKRATINSNFEELNRELKEVPGIGDIWCEYDETLLKVESQEGGTAVYSTVESAQYFNFNTLSPKINWDQQGKAPSLYTGLGILGTFLGLTLGLLGQEFGVDVDIKQLSAGVTRLLSGVGTAFTTSLVGLVIALSYTGIIKVKMNSIAEAISKVQMQLDRLFVLKTPESFMYDELKELKKQTKELASFNSEIAYAIGAQIDEKLAQNFKPTLDELLIAIKELNNAGASSIAETMNNSMGSELASFGSSIKEAGATLQENSTHTQLLLAEMEKTLGGVTQKISDVLLSAAQSQDNSSSSIKANTEFMIAALKSAVSEMQTSLSSSMKEMTSVIGANFSDSAKMLNEILEKQAREQSAGSSQVLEQIRLMTSSLEESFSLLTSRFETSQDASAEKISQLLASVTENISVISERLKHQSQTTNDSMIQLTDDLSNTILRVTTSFEDVYSSNNKEMQESMESFSSLIKNSSDMIESASETADKFKGAASIIAQSSERLKSVNELSSKFQQIFQEQVKEVLASVDAHGKMSSQNLELLRSLYASMKSNVDAYGASMKTLQTDIDGVFAALSDRVKEYSLTVSDTLHGQLQVFDSDIGTAMGSIGAGVDEIKGAVEEINDAVGNLAHELQKIKRQ
ncbi:MAG: anti-phage ZorAB system protein ZorA [Cloacibacillus sp.]